MIPQIFTRMRSQSRHSQSYQVLYVAFEDGVIRREYEYSRATHAEGDLCREFSQLYNHQKSINRNIIINNGVSQVYIYSFLSPCAEPGHECWRLLKGLATQFPVNDRYHLAYTRLYDGISGHQSESERAEILKRSKAGLDNLQQGGSWKVHHVD